MTTKALLGYAVCCELTLAVAGMLCGRLAGISAIADLVWDWRAMLRGVAAAVPLLICFAATWSSGLASLRRIRSELQRLLPTLLGNVGLAGVVLVSAAAGVGEEIFFRGFLQGWLERTTNEEVALIAAGVAFGLAHAITPTYIVIATIMGIYLGIVWRTTGNLLAPIATHAAYDAIVLWYILRRATPPNDAVD